MKKGIVITAAMALVLALSPFSYAKYIEGYKVVGVSEKQVTIQKGDADTVMVTVKKASKYKVGDKVKYNADTLKIRKIVKEPYAGC